MVNVGQQVCMPIKTEAHTTESSGGRAFEDEGFSRLFERSMRLYRPLTAQKPPGEFSGQQGQGLKGSDTGNAAGGYRQTTEESQSILSGQDRKSLTAGNVKGREAASFSKDVQSTKANEKPQPEKDGLVNSEAILLVMDQLLALLQNLYLTMGELKTEGMPEEETASELSGIAEMQKLFETQLAELLKLLGESEGVQGSKPIDDFAGKLEQLAGKDLFHTLKALLQGDETVSVKELTPLRDLVLKMLHEAENVKENMSTDSARKTESGKTAAPIKPVMDTEEAPNELKPGSGIQNEENPAGQKEGANTTDPQRRSAMVTEQDDTKAETTGEARLSNSKTESVANPVQEFAASDQTVGVIRDAPEASSVMKDTVIAKTDVLSQVIEKAEVLLDENKSEMILQLKPESLGKLSLRVIHERGEIMARFVAENDQVRALLESNLQLLKDALEKNGLAVQNLSVSVGQHGQRQNGDGSQKGKTSAGRTGMPAVPATENGQRIYRQRGLEEESLLAEGTRINLTA